MFNDVVVTKTNKSSGMAAESYIPSGTPNHIDRIDNLKMDFSAVKDISDTFGKDEHPGLKTPTANVKSQMNTPSSTELKISQTDMTRLRDEILSVKRDLEQTQTSGQQFSSPIGANQGVINSIVSKLSNMLEMYEQVAAQYEVQLKQFLMAKKASKMDSSINNSNNTARLEEEIGMLLKEKEGLFNEFDRNRNQLYEEIQRNEQYKERLRALEHDNSEYQRLLQEKDEIMRELSFERTKVKTEIDIEHTMEEEHKRRVREQERQYEKLISDLKSRHELELHQKKLQAADLQNEIAFLKQSEKVLEEELNNRRSRTSKDESDIIAENRKLHDETFSLSKQMIELKKSLEESQLAKQRTEEKLAEMTEHEALVNDRYKQVRSDNDELKWALDSSKKEIDRLTGLLQEQAQSLSEKDKKVESFSERIRDLEKSQVQEYEQEIKRLNSLLSEEKIRGSGPLEQVVQLKRKISLIEREKELLEEQLKMKRLSAYSQGEFQTFSSFVQGLKRHIEAEILSIEPMRLTLADVIKSREMVEILIKVTEDVRIRVLKHLAQVEDVIKSRTTGFNLTDDRSSLLSKPGISQQPYQQYQSQSQSQSQSQDVGSQVETVKIERIRNFDIPAQVPSNSIRRLEFSSDSRYLREPLGVTGSLQNRSDEIGGSGSSGELENRVNNFRNLVSDMKTRSSVPIAGSSSSASSNNNNHSSGFTSNYNYNTNGTNGNAGITGNTGSYNYNTSIPYSSRSGNLNTQKSTTSTSSYYNRNGNIVQKAQEPVRCTLCNEIGHDALNCPDYLTFDSSEDVLLNDMRSNFRGTSTSNGNQQKVPHSDNLNNFGKYSFSHISAR